ncbi:HupE/UreJ family protein [Ancylobacter sonchi]|uniref:HupE/UreJ family protein n=1 Tax=Ancylobacter sonchi TaxID=1937790 RepID=UPI001BD6B8BB|nr:HupE/UreJ family protein [Ancylobacter sonchi]MBS7534777.1 HupE/UreJ family protein [Ancylobacter sonchi]
MGLRSSRASAFTAALSVLALSPSLAFAHTGVGATHGFAHGFMHPVTGLDHVLAMVTVGLFAWQLGGRAIWAVPSAFVAVMAIGGGLGMAGLDVPFVELGIALSVVVLGAVVALRLEAPLALAMGLVGFFAMFHGYAHGVEMPENAGGLSYGAGFMAGTALLHLAGLGIGMTIGRLADAHGRDWTRAVGALVCVIGVGLVSGIF